MKRVAKSVLLEYAAPRMFELVADVERYPQFLPWCERVEILSREPSGDGAPQALTARLQLHFAGLRHAFTTRTTLDRPSEIRIALVDGPFSALDGRWRFKPIGDEVVDHACRVDFEMSYAFAGGAALQGALAPVFDRVANTFVDAFVRRAEQVHGRP